MKLRFRFSTRMLLILIVISAFPCWWIGSEIHQYRAEQNALIHMREVNPRTNCLYENQTPRLFSRIGIKPKWMDRVTRIDATGVCSGIPWEDYPKSQIEFDDNNLNEVLVDLKKFQELREICFQVTKLSDRSLDALANFPEVETMYLNETDITNSGVEQLRLLMPSTKISHHQARSR